MSENTVPRIDPRFDPRFQRGYDPDVAAWAPNDAAVSAPMDAASPADAAGSTPPAPPVSSRAHDQSRPQVGDDPAEAIRALVASAWDARPDAPAAADPPDRRPQAAHGESESIPSPNGRPPIGRLWIALGSSIALVLVGWVLLWNAVSDPRWYTGSGTGIDAEFTQFFLSVAPGLMQAGAIGCVAVLATWAVLGRRAWAREADE